MSKPSVEDYDRIRERMKQLFPDTTPYTKEEKEEEGTKLPYNYIFVKDGKYHTSCYTCYQSVTWIRNIYPEDVESFIAVHNSLMSTLKKNFHKSKGGDYWVCSDCREDD